ncbi:MULTISPECIES: metal ABC transporter substrate-binding protein [Brevibacillus]|jgi:zinc transport system substrate-binding protein|uniref:metal ABC transporter substrate-binding protein n=1 Tax=Brevibacillus TaxID=55080 RepID=UPI0014925184|nr:MULTISPECIES: metal ABC transporter substrate-binding protein [Brevibacillus]MDT3416803.1 zinc transport system substrate-binding protein [Brevibacillus aydinogluensis]NNV04231.1 zinc ABC transporter substrate-binding protein [Brevibacillus sp. MCWH]
MKKSLLTILSVITAAALAGCGAQDASQNGPQTDAGASKLKVYTSIYPLEFAAKRIAGDHAEVTNIVPTGVEPHDFEPTAQDMVGLSGADLFIYNGNGFEAWVDKAVEGLDKNKTVVINATEGLELLKAAEDHQHGDEHQEGSAEHGHEEHEEGGSTKAHEHGQFDPHVWLDPTMLKEQAEKIKAALAQKDQAHAADYEANFKQLASDLDQLDQEFQEMVAKAPKKEFMVSHSAFAYLAHRYGLKQVAISGLNPADEPSPSDMKELVEHIKEHNISYVLFETLVSPKVAEVIAKEAGVKTGTLNPLEGLTEQEAQSGKDYLSIMRDNLNMLRTALQ